MAKGGDILEEHNYIVYKHTFPNNKVYIGITQQNPEKRWKKGLGYDSHQTLMKRAIKKYGWNNIKKTNEQKRKISETTKKAMQNPKLKQKLSVLAKNRKNNTKKVRCIETGKIYNMIIEAAKDTKTNCNCISQVCNGKRKIANNLHWEFIKEE